MVVAAPGGDGRGGEAQGVARPLKQLAEREESSPTPTGEHYHKDFSVQGAWGAGLTVAVLAATLVVGAIELWGDLSGSHLARWLGVGVGVVVGVVVLVVARWWVRDKKMWSCVTAGVVFAVTCVVGALLVTADDRARVVLWYVLIALGVLVLVSHYFSRSTLLGVTVLLLAFVLGNTIRVGQAASDEERVAQARASLTHLMAERCALADDEAHPPDATAVQVLDQAGRWIVHAWPDPTSAVPASLACSSFGLSPDHADDVQDPSTITPAFAAHNSSATFLSANLARAELAVADGAVAVATDAKVTSAAEARRDAARSALAAAESSGASSSSSSTALDVLSTGADQVVDSMPVFRGASVPVELAAAGWILVALLFLLVLRSLSIHASRGGIGPVTINTKENRADALRVYLARNIPEPGTVPASGALTTVTDLVAAEAEIDTASKWLKPIIDAVAGVFNAPSGYDVTFMDIADQTDPPVGTAGEGQAAVSVLVADTRTKRELALSQPFHGSGSEPWRTAAYWAAAVIFEHCIEVPAWASWRQSASPALSAYFAPQDTGQEPSATALEQALHNAPDNGVLLMYAAAKADVAQDWGTSFFYALRAASSHPSYLIARYRLSIAASHFALDTAAWTAVDTADRQQIITLLCDHAYTTHQKHLPSEEAAVKLGEWWKAIGTAAPSPVGPDEVKRALIDLGRSLAVSLQRSLKTRRLVPGVLCRTQRRATLDLFRRSDLGQTRRRALSEMARSIELIAEVRNAPVAPAGGVQGGLPDDLRRKIGKLEERAVDRSSGWQLPYNVGCLYATCAGRLEPDEPARAGKTDRAYEHLWRALERPGSAALKAEWVAVDPDLGALRTDPPDARWSMLVQRTDGAT
jgi:hypothetical protein